MIFFFIIYSDNDIVQEQSMGITFSTFLCKTVSQHGPSFFSKACGPAALARTLPAI